VERWRPTSEGEVNSIFTAEVAEGRRELQREKKGKLGVFAIERAASASLLQSSAILCALCGKKRETLNYSDATFVATVSDQQRYSGSRQQLFSLPSEIWPECRENIGFQLWSEWRLAARRSLRNHPS
jgi:hypothetical protein